MVEMCCVALLGKSTTVQNHNFNHLFGLKSPANYGSCELISRISCGAFVQTVRDFVFLDCDVSVCIFW